MGYDQHFGNDGEGPTDDIEFVRGETARSDTVEGNQAQRDRLKASAIKRMDTAEHWILISFDPQTEGGRPCSWLGFCSAAGTKMQTLKFFIEMLIDGSQMVRAVMARVLRDAQEKQRKGKGS